MNNITFPFQLHMKIETVSAGWPFRTASEIGRSPNLVAVTWKYKKLI